MRRPPRNAPILSPIPRVAGGGADPGGREGRGGRGGRRAGGASRDAFRGLPSGNLLLVWVAAGIYAIVFLLVSKERYDTFAFRDQDLSQHAQALWALLHGSTQISIFGVSFLGNHLHWATFALAPLYAMFPSPVLLLAVQTFALAAGAIPLFHIAERRVGGRLGLAVVAAYLLYPALGYVNLAEFHMPALAVPLLFAAHLAYERDRRRTLAVLLVAIALVQENFALFGVAYGALLAWRRRDWRLGVPLAIGSAAYFIVALEVVLPIFWKHLPPPPPAVPGAPPAGLFGSLGGSVPEMVANFARDPIGSLARAYTPGKLKWLAHLVLPLALLPLAGFEWLAPAVPFFLQHYCSVRANETLVKSHYNAELVPFLLIAAVAGLARARRFLPGRDGAIAIGGALVAAAVTTNLWLGCQIYLARDLIELRVPRAATTRSQLIAMIPKDASVVASFDVLPHLVNRSRLYTLDHIARGTYTLSTRPYRLPDDARYALVHWMDDITFREYGNGRLDENLARAFADGSWRVLYAAGSITLLNRAGPSDRGAANDLGAAGDRGDAAAPMPRRPFAGEPQLFQIASTPPPGFSGPKFVVDGALELLDASVVAEPTLATDRIRIALAWRLRAPAPGQYVARVELIDTKGTALAAAVHPICYNIYPPTRWTPGEIVREDVWLPIAAPLPAGDYGVAVRADAYLVERSVEFERLSESVIVANNRAIVSAWRKN